MPASTRLVLMFTTAGFNSLANSTQFGAGIGAGATGSERSLQSGVDAVVGKPNRGTSATTTSSSKAAAGHAHRRYRRFAIMASLLLCSGITLDTERSGRT